MQAFITLRGPAAPLMLRDVDTDMLAPAHGGRSGLGARAFAPLRYRPDGSEEPGFVLNDPRFRRAPILLMGRNFGCGSSRESAVTALVAIGVRCVIAPSFGDIFAGNCIQHGVLPALLDEPGVLALAADARTGGCFEVDLRSCGITAPSGRRADFGIDPTWRSRLLEGLDDFGVTLRQAPDIDTFQARDRDRRPWVYDIPPGGTLP